MRVTIQQLQSRNDNIGPELEGTKDFELAVNENFSMYLNLANGALFLSNPGEYKRNDITVSMIQYTTNVARIHV